MVRRLARWLRTVGYDTAYHNPISDDELASLARREGRIVLTRDPGLPGRFADLRIHVLRDESPWIQFREVILEFGLDLEHGLFTRCTVCNARVTPVSKEDFREEIPPRVYQKVCEFYRCPECDRLYWPGTHVQKIKARLDEMRETISKGKEPNE